MHIPQGAAGICSLFHAGPVLPRVNGEAVKEASLGATVLLDAVIRAVRALPGVKPASLEAAVADPVLGAGPAPGVKGVETKKGSNGANYCI